MDLIIVESPSKAKTIEKYLKGKYKVDASGGHVRDLPERQMGVDIAGNFEPRYVINPDKKQTIARLSEKAAKGRMLARGDDEQQALRRIREDQERFSPAMKALVQPDLVLLSDIFPPEAIYNIVLKFIGENEYWSWKYV